jgi:transitional endoplasmic reticulum ATPase
MAIAATEASATKPAWLEDLIKDFKAGVAHSFILHGGVYDYAEYPKKDVPVRGYIAEALSYQYQVVTYAPDEGIRFPNDDPEKSERKRFEILVGLAGQQQEQSIMAAALREQGGGTDEAELPRSPAEAIPLLIEFLRMAQPRNAADKRPAVIIERLDLIAPPGDKAVLDGGRLSLLALMHRVGTDPQIHKTAGMLVMLSPTLEEIHSDLRAGSSGLRAIEIPPPNFEQRLAYIRRIVDAKNLKLELSEAEFAAATAGLFRRHIEDIALRAVLLNRTVTRSLVNERKKEQIATEYAEVLEVVDPKHGFEAIAGHPHATEYLKKRIVRAFADPDLADLLPMGIMLLGPSGTGKTYLAWALAKECGVNFVKMNVGALRGGIVGETDRRVAKAFVGLRALAPCVVFLDEIDQQFRRGQGGSDSGGGGAAENSLFAAMLEFFGSPENRGRILAVAASNLPKVIDAALMRPGRFDVKIPLLPPQTGKERADVVAVLLKKYGAVIESDHPVLAEIGESTSGWTQAELERLVTEAQGTARLEDVPLAEALLEARSSMRAATRDIEKMTWQALEACDNAKLVPERFREAIGQAAEPKAKAIEQRDAGMKDESRASRDLEL